MQKKMVLIDIRQNKQRGTLILSDAKETEQVPGRPGQPNLKGNSVAVQLDDPKEAATFEIGEVYTVSITKD